ncbi:hypothetical protein CY34DRAFT_808174 [Suillus luteus UH-Slu-Lm8-n1]|uniref:Extracellular membrane protein CFEM domain-containing protein n=1 Tax=Suillus luteus UH-Slu-Lm8-n1 TaxID=930992 RepID=A0A0D0B6U5_9AGAM|nr:hypothetical protein CY34DRAFT_808174 [Suillus luteus UH-Slu-Lm8-n1]
MRFAFVTVLAVVTALASSISATPTEPAEVPAPGDCPRFCTSKSDCQFVAGTAGLVILRCECLSFHTDAV